MAKQKQGRGERLKFELIGIGILTFGLLVLTALVTSDIGVVNRALVSAFRAAFGIGTYVIPITLIGFGIFLMVKLEAIKFRRPVVGLILFFLAFLGLVHLQAPSWLMWEVGGREAYGGYMGAGLAWGLRKCFGGLGSHIVLGALLLISILLVSDVSLIAMLRRLGQGLGYIYKAVGMRLRKRRAKRLEKRAVKPEVKMVPAKAVGLTGQGEVVEVEEKPKLLQLKPPAVSKPYELPPLSLLEEIEVPTRVRVKGEATANIETIEDTLENFGVSAKVLEISRGPTVTRYEIQLAPGIRIKQVANLADDLALALAAINVRVEAPIPGKSAIGIEVPNREVSWVHIRELLELEEFQNSSSKLCFALGKDVAGEPWFADLARMPHLLIAGATGTGKTVCINSIIISLLFRNTPEELKLLLVDPKRIELPIYDGIPHLVAPVVKDVKMASKLLEWAIGEMERRYDLFADVGVRHIQGYNAQIGEGEKPLPYIVIIVDELADLMLQKPADFEYCICRLAQLARATGMHLIISTQRPSVDVITGTIKANISSRIAFGVSSQVDSRVIIDMNGAERLLGNGDMLFLPMEAMKPVRIQGTFVTEKEIEGIVSYWRGQGLPEYAEAVAEIEREEAMLEGVDDKLFEAAAKLVVATGYGSTSMLQRKFKIGYNRAGRLMDLLEARGIVSPPDANNPSKPRKVLIGLEGLEGLLRQ